MATLLYIQASPRVDRSHSIHVADEFIKEYSKINPDDKVMTINLFQTELPEMNAVAIQGKYNIFHNLDYSETEKQVWSKVEEVIDIFKSADKYIFAIPMWNFGIPYRLKHFFDVIVQPSYTFGMDDGDYVGLITDKPAALIYASGGSYNKTTGEFSNLDYQKPYMDQILRFLGFETIHHITVEPTIHGGPEVAQQSRFEASEKAKQVAQNF